MSTNNSYKYFVGIDVSKYFHTVSIINEDNEVIKQNLNFKNTLQGLTDLSKLLLDYQSHGDTIIGCEATGHYWLNLFQHLNQQQLVLSVFNPLQVASLRNHNLRGSKTDSNDSVLIARVLKFGLASPKKLPEEQAFELKELCRFRLDTKNQLVSTKLKIVTILDQIFPEFHSVFKDVSSKTARTVLEEFPNPEWFDSITTRKLTNLLKRVSRSYFGQSTAENLKQHAKETIGLKFGLNSFILQIKLLLEQLSYLENQIKLLDLEITRLVENQSTCLTSIPGISTVIAGTILGERAGFESHGAKSFLAFAGLDPKKNDSGNKLGHSRISKRGSRYLRQALWLAASSARMHSPTFKRIYEEQKNKGKHHMVAISHTAKKMAYIVDSVLRTNIPFKENVLKS